MENGLTIIPLLVIFFTCGVKGLSQIMDERIEK